MQKKGTKRQDPVHVVEAQAVKEEEEDDDNVKVGLCRKCQNMPD